MAGVQFGGLASGLDTNGIIDGLMKAERIPLTRMTSKKSRVDKASSTLTGFAAKLTGLKTAAESIGSADKFSSFSASSSDTAVVSTVTGAAASGSYQLTVTALAREQRSYSNSFGSASDALGLAGTIDVGINGTSQQISIAADDSLASIASKLSTSGARISASVLFDGTNYRLQVRGLDTGAQNAVSFAESGLALGLDVPANTFQAATDAEIVIDGITVKRPTNQVTGVVPGVTLALTKVSASPIELRVQEDSDSLAGKLRTLVTAYNDVVNAGRAAAGYGSAPAAVEELAGDSVVRTILGSLSRTMYTPVAGATAKYNTLASVGLSLTRDGLMKLDESKLKSALVADATGVAKLFVVDAALGATGVTGTFKAVVDQATGSSTAALQTRIDAFGTQSRRLQKQADDFQIRLDKTENRLRNQFTSMEQRVSAYTSQTNALVGFNSSGNQ